MIKNKLLTPIYCLAAATSIAPVLASVSCKDSDIEKSYKCVGSVEYDGYIPNECLTGNKIKLSKNKKYQFTIANIEGGSEGINASLFALITDWKGGEKPTYYDLQTNEIISVKHNNVDETTKIEKEDEYFILNNKKGYSSGKLEITIKLLNDVECIPNFEDA